ncbi:hypothetical protein VCHA53O466_50367 [Vibrio chagasii]|nr:hypothetical protein VCHA53O466_50367 [Vibrio chagasii]
MPNCERIDTRTPKTINFIQRGQLKFKGMIDYSLVADIKTQKDSIEIVCKKHGKMTVVVKSHLESEYGCKKCASDAKKITRATVIKRAKEKFGDKFDYSGLPVELSNMRTKVNVTCPIHGEISVTPNSHINSEFGCKDCAEDSLVASKQEFILKAKKVHGDKYDYSESVFGGYKAPINIICPTHGAFEQMAENHTSGSGCSECAIESSRLKVDDVVSEVQELIRDSSSTYVGFDNASRRVSLTCSKHGEFSQILSNLRKGFLCSDCKRER